MPSAILRSMRASINSLLRWQSRRTTKGSVRQVLQRRSWGHGLVGSCGLAELNFLVIFEIVHIEVAVGFELVLVGLDG